jgi:hypothetical protein
VHTRCNLGARYRWGIEGAFLVEKHQGYSYEHAFAKPWNAMKGYHYLMRLAHLLNTLGALTKKSYQAFAGFSSACKARKGAHSQLCNSFILRFAAYRPAETLSCVGGGKKVPDLTKEPEPA